MAALYIALGCREVLKPVLHFLDATTARSPVLDMAVAAILLTLPTAYLFIVGVILPVALQITLQPPPAAFSRAGFWWSVALGFALLLLFVTVPLVAFLFLTAINGA